MKIPFLSFESINNSVGHKLVKAFQNVLNSQWYILGEKVEQFEKEYAYFNKVKYCIGVSNGLDALHLSLRALEIKKNDEVIVPSNTYIATALAVSYVGATPVFVEPDINTYNIDPRKIEEAISSKTKAIIPVHLYGQCCEMNAIMKLSKKYNISVVEDNAQSQGSSYSGKLAGSFGVINGTSFYPGKNIGALGDAGAVTTDDSALAEKIKIFRNYGSEKKYYNSVIGYNMRLDELQAALLSVKLKVLSKWLNERQQIAEWYHESLKGIGDITLPVTAKKATHVYHLYVIRTKFRDSLQEYLKKKGIGTLIHYPIPPHLQKAYTHLGFKRGNFPIAEQIANSCLSIPLWPGMKKEHVYYVSDSIKNFFKRS